MSVFLSKVVVENADANDDGNWVLVQPLIYQSNVAKQTFTVPAGFETNFASVPRIPFVYDYAGGRANEAAALHDFLYTTCPVTRSMADAVLREASILTGVGVWRSNVMWLGVRLFGLSHWNTK